MALIGARVGETGWWEMCDLDYIIHPNHTGFQYVSKILRYALLDHIVLRRCAAAVTLNGVAMNILRSSGMLATFSCYGLVSPDLFQRIIFSASLEAERDVQIAEKLG
jgi:hypothetical protein